MSLDQHFQTLFASLLIDGIITMDSIDDAKQAMLTDLLEIIGEDTPLYPKDGGMVDGENIVRSFKNDLRQELREKIKAYCGV